MPPINEASESEVDEKNLTLDKGNKTGPRGDSLRSLKLKLPKQKELSQKVIDSIYEKFQTSQKKAMFKEKIAPLVSYLEALEQTVALQQKRLECSKQDKKVEIIKVAGKEKMNKNVELIYKNVTAKTWFPFDTDGAPHKYTKIEEWPDSLEDEEGQQRYNFIKTLNDERNNQEKHYRNAIRK
jgi:hypothetical protein